MGEEIILNVLPRETRVAVVEQGLLQELFIERLDTKGTLGNIYKGKVTRILPGMQSAFLDIGHPRSAFVHVSDLLEPREGTLDDEGASMVPDIRELLYEGKKLLVQVTKESIGTKGARLSTNISLASRFLVYMPGNTRVGISQRIEDDDERQRLRDILEKVRIEQGEGGFIVRTAAEMASEEEIAKDAELLRLRWEAICEDSKDATPPVLVFDDLPLHLRVMRDIINFHTDRIIVDDKAICETLDNFLKDFIPDKAECLEYVRDEVSLFDVYNLEDQIETALDRNVPLKSGGYLVIDQTEAMTTVDVNTGAFVGKKDLEETIYRTNLEAAAAIPRQLRLRNIGGIVILDFIDMADEEHKRQVIRTLEKGQQSDRVKWKISEISELGLVEMTRKRTHESLLQQMCGPCPSCDGKGFIKTPESVCLEIFREIRRRASGLRGKGCLIMASQVVVDRLLDEDAACIRELSGSIGTDIRFQVEASYTQEQFDVVLPL
ncbi:MAG: ribonuclease G [Pseudomonadales bacterium]